MSSDVNVDVKPVTVNINGLDDIDATIGATLNATADIGLDDVNVDLNTHITVDELKADIKTRLTLDEIRADIQASLKELAPIFFHFLWDGVPLVKVGFPHRYRLAFTLCGKEFFAITFCGESELITEKTPCPGPPGGNNG